MATVKIALILRVAMINVKIGRAVKMGKLNLCSCGNKPRLTHVYEPTGDVLTPYSVVICDKCNNVTKKSYDSDEEAIDAWNRVVKPCNDSAKNDVCKNNGNSEMTTIEKLQYIHDVIIVETGLFDGHGFEEAILAAIKAIEAQPKYEATLKMMANENIPDNSYQFCNACINEDTSRSRYAGRVCQRYEGEKGVIYTNECGRAAIVYYKNKVGLDGGKNGVW